MEKMKKAEATEKKAFRKAEEIQAEETKETENKISPSEERILFIV